MFFVLRTIPTETQYEYVKSKRNIQPSSETKYRIKGMIKSSRVVFGLVFTKDFVGFGRRRSAHRDVSPGYGTTMDDAELIQLLWTAHVILLRNFEFSRCYILCFVPFILVWCFHTSSSSISRSRRRHQK